MQRHSMSSSEAMLPMSKLEARHREVLLQSDSREWSLQGCPRLLSSAWPECMFLARNCYVCDVGHHWEELPWPSHGRKYLVGELRLDGAGVFDVALHLRHAVGRLQRLRLQLVHCQDVGLQRTDNHRLKYHLLLYMVLRVFALSW